MAVVDRWHKVRPAPGDEPCAQHRGLVATADHGRGGRWQVRWRDEHGAQRKRNFKHKVGVDPNRHAEAFDAKVREQLHAGTYVDPAAGKITLRAYAEQWVSGLTWDPATVALTESRLRTHVYPDGKLGGKPMAVLAKRPSMIQQWIKGLESKLEPSTIRGVTGLVSAVFSAAIDDGIVARNPFHAGSVRPPKPKRRKVVPWDLPTLETVAGALDSRYEAMAYLGAGCGHRQGELFGVALPDVDFLRRVVHVRRQVRLVDGRLVFSLPKGGKERSVPLPSSVGLRLSAHLAEHGTTRVTLPWTTADGEPTSARLLFTTADGRALRRGAFNKLWIAARAGVAEGRANGTHVLRHTAASAWLAAGVDVRTVAEYLGHTNPGFTLKTYAHLMPDAADRARRAMDEFFQRSAPDVPSEGSQ